MIYDCNRFFNIKISNYFLYNKKNKAKIGKIKYTIKFIIIYN